jgi:hypothetical protein
MVLDAIRSGRRYVFTHAETEHVVAARHDAVAAGFAG